MRNFWRGFGARLFVLCLAAGLVSGHAEASEYSKAGYVPIQHNGRIKPLASFSSQAVKLISGRAKWNKTDSLSLILRAMQSPQDVADWKWIRIDYPELKEEMSLDKDAHFFSYNDLLDNLVVLDTLVRGAKTKRDNDERPSKLEQKAENLYTKVRTVELMTSGEIYTLIPMGAGHAWESPLFIKGNLWNEFTAWIQMYGRSREDFDIQTQKWLETVHAIPSEADAGKLNLEVFYDRFHPFEWAAVGYFLMFFICLFAGKNKTAKTVAVAALAAAFVFHTLGLVLRVIILSRPPVSNMYESMVFMNWALIVAAILFAVARKNLIPLTTAALASGLIMLYANLLPIDPSLEVLVPVLRSNYWLLIHVMTIVASYGIFGLALALGHRHLYNSVHGRFTKKADEESAHLIQRIIQLGVVFIGTGTVLGGVWANESWGRFWGWDPKETWALITFLGYLIPVHLRFAKKLSNFGLAMFAVLNFLLVLMTWYGVNFVLGRGLHSYGAGSGGMSWVIYFLVFEAAFIGYILGNKKRTKARR